MPETISRQLAAWRKKYPEGKITTTAMTVGGKKYNLPSVKAKGNWRQFIKFIQEWKKNPTIENFVKLSKKLEKTLVNFYLVSDFKIEKFNSKNTIYKIIFNSSPDKFLDKMLSFGFNIDTTNDVWKLR